MVTYEVTIPEYAQRPYLGCKGRASVYARVSNEGDTKTASLESQAQGPIDALVAAGFYLTYEDCEFERFSGVGSLAYRAKLLSLRDRVQAGYYKAFAVHDPDRLVRGLEVCQVVADMEAAGCEVWLNGKLSEPSDERDLILMIGGYASKKEAKQILERTNRGREKLRAKGEWVGAGPARYGYVFDKDSRSRNAHPEHARTVRYIFEQIAAGVSTIRLAKVLNAPGGPPPPAATRNTPNATKKKWLWSAARVGFMVREETYLGKAYSNRYRYKTDENGRPVLRGKKGILVAVPRSEWVEADAAGVKTEQIVPDELWLAANAQLDQNSTKRKIDETRQEKRPYLLRGFLYCGQCRQRMHPNMRHVGGRNGKKYPCYQCKTKYNPFFGHPECKSYTVQGNKIEGVVRPILDAMIADPKFVESSIELAFQAEGSESLLAGELERTQASVATLNSQIEAYAADLEDPDLGDRSRKAIRTKMKMVEDTLDAQEEHEKDIVAKLAPLKDRERLKAAYLNRCREVRETLAGKPLAMEDYRLAMEGLGVKFFYLQGKLEIECQPGVDLGVVLPSSRRRRSARC
jgi:DNA invertase Pin-like site-specific DNA recombinase